VWTNIYVSYFFIYPLKGGLSTTHNMRFASRNHYPWKSHKFFLDGYNRWVRNAMVRKEIIFWHNHFLTHSFYGPTPSLFRHSNIWQVRLLWGVRWLQFEWKIFSIFIVYLDRYIFRALENSPCGCGSWHGGSRLMTLRQVFDLSCIGWALN
jgi:hypothetical protein